MCRKLFSLIACLVLVLTFGVVSGAAQEEEGGEFVIRPASINPPDGSVDIYVPLGDNVIIRSGWGACTRGLAQAWTNQNEISLWVNGESVFSSLRESKSFWGEPESFLLPDESSCINDVDSGWRVYWEYPLGELAEGTYNIHYEENVDHPFLDGGDYDGDGKPDIDEWHISVDFNIIVTEMGSISGTVTEEGTGEPIEGIFVFACEVDVYCDSTHTDSNGFYTISLPIGKYRVGTYTEADYISEFYNDKIYWEEANDVFVSAGKETPNINFALLPAGIISGRVTSEYGDPLAGLWVDACEYDTESYCSSAETNEDGYYSILLPPGEYWVQVSVEQDWIGQVYDVDPQDGVPDRVAVIVGEDTAGIDFELLAAGTISGRVTSEYGDPLAGLWVDACEYDTESYCSSAETNDDGYYSILLPPGEYWVQVWVEQDWIGQRYDFDQDGEADRVAVTVGEDTAGIDFVLLAAGNIKGQVTSEYGEPLPGLWVDACEYDTQSFCASAPTNDDGYYTIPALPGEYWVQVFPETDWIGQMYDADQDGESDRVAVTVGEDTAGIDFQLLAAGMISGTVTTVDGNGNTVPVNELWVDACHESVPPEMWNNSPLCNGAQTDQDGFYTITRLMPGNYRVVTWGTDDLSLQFYDGVLNYYEASLVTVEPGQTKEGVNFSLFESGPAFNAWPVENYVDGWGWEIDVPVNLTILDGTGTVYTATESPFYPEWNPDTPWVIFEFQGEFDLQPGFIVTLDNGIHIKQHTVTSLEVTDTDLTTSSVSGKAEPGSHVYVWYYFDEGRVDRHEVADSSGNWTADFSVPGDEPGEEQTYMIPTGAGGEANQVDFDGDGTQVNWWMPEP